MSDRPVWYEGAAQEAWEESQRIIRNLRRSEELLGYADDPVGFGEKELGEDFTDDIKAVMNSVRDNPITVARSATGPGKSHGAARIAVWFYRVFQDAKVYTTAAPPFENLKRILWGEIMSVVRKKPNLFRDDIVRSMSITRHPQSFIAGVAIPTSGTSEERVAKFSGKHAPHLLFIVDEGDAVPDEIYEGIEGCMSGGVMTRLLIMFNPKQETGYVYQLERDGRANVVEVSAITHPNVVTGMPVIPGAVSREVVVRRINEWTRPLVEGEIVQADCFELPDFLVGATAQAQNGVYYQPLRVGMRKIIDPAFSYMVLGQYPMQSEFQLISQSWIDQARVRHDLYIASHGDQPPQGVLPILGVDVAEFGIDANVACLRYGSYMRFEHWSGVDPDLSARRTLQMYRNYRANIAMIDATGIGSGIAPSIVRMSEQKEDVRAIGVKFSAKPSKIITTEKGEFRFLRDQLYWAVREWLRTDNTAMLPHDPMLLEELKTPRYRNNPYTGKIEITDKDTLRKLLKRSPDRFDALALTFTPIERAKVLMLQTDRNYVEA